MKLKPCPFCGSTSIEIVQYGKNDYQAFCRNCYVTTAPVLGWGERGGEAYCKAFIELETLLKQVEATKESIKKMQRYT